MWDYLLDGASLCLLFRLKYFHLSIQSRAHHSLCSLAVLCHPPFLRCLQEVSICLYSFANLGHLLPQRRSVSPGPLVSSRSLSPSSSSSSTLEQASRMPSSTSAASRSLSSSAALSTREQPETDFSLGASFRFGSKWEGEEVAEEGQSESSDNLPNACRASSGDTTLQAPGEVEANDREKKRKAGGVKDPTPHQRQAGKERLTVFGASFKVGREGKIERTVLYACTKRAGANQAVSGGKSGEVWSMVCRYAQDSGVPLWLLTVHRMPHRSRTRYESKIRRPVCHIRPTPYVKTALLAVRPVLPVKLKALLP